LEGKILIAERKSREAVLRELTRKVFSNTLESLKRLEDPVIHIPVRSPKTVEYDPKRDVVLLKEKYLKRNFMNLGNVRRFVQTQAVAATIVELLKLDKHAQLRDVFYNRAYLFETQAESDNIIEDLAAALGTTRESLHIVASSKGVCIGKLKVRDHGDVIDCSKLGTSGLAISPFVDEYEFVEYDADFILVIEKDAAFSRLVEDRFWEKHRCILVTGKGQADIATRRFVRRLNHELGLPVYLLVDADSYGFYIYSVYRRGSISFSFESLSLATRDAKLLGLLPSDLDKYGVPRYARLKMTEHDIKFLQKIRSYPWFQKEAFQREFDIMEKTGEKAEIQALAAKGLTYLSEKYIPEKLKNEDWIE